jgi:putative transposase
MDLSTRRVETGGIAGSANELWMLQIARNLTDAIDGFLRDKRYLIHDPDPLYTKALRNTIREFVTHYHIERNHQGFENRLIVPPEMIDTGTASSEKARTARWAS